MHTSISVPSNKQAKRLYTNQMLQQKLSSMMEKREKNENLMILFLVQW